ncbi:MULTISPECIES: hormogonium polysaccharide secretion pseudopilin HpsB [unclassified Okeania]|uniref:hormogonium polysaccharide secretion pseudopilin HpsB n=1 Tax=unclassified Okeania TaxID=2634635 RepID=UPI0013BE5B74|nr:MULTISPECIES: hormogonium polysaccharide secretion pseudopilin HpsB [unclassified Okeania]NEP06475.1 type II secretion system protein [Okeania sp. SIO4D6]NET15459.1 type II secretion system protein [Okeania sp. SIO1H6]NEP75394.1 type II secretion system protein [Okeania sp. SIO2G5]NEP96491.1 type II secretion system protein [Okeania sp. SIO2F5]NEQ94279.1 type II secretion system protein [Okeania sp. SIO2G4]
MMKLKKMQSLPRSPEAGYTIMEGLVAIIMVSFLMSAVAPVIALSVGTRVQARRLELAAQAARSYIDWVRYDPVDRGPNQIGLDFKDVNPPQLGDLVCQDGAYCTTPTPNPAQSNQSNYLFCVDGDGDQECKKDSLSDMLVQGSRNQGITYNASLSPEENKRRGYALGVRVYRADAFQENSLCPSGAGCPDPGTQQSVVTNAIGNRRLPMVEIITEIAPTENSFQNYQDRLKSPTN